MSHIPIETAFESPAALIERGREHIQQARAEVGGFFERKPYTRLVEFDPNTGQDVHKIRLAASIPGKVRTIVKDATANFRDALDHAVYASAVCLCGGDPDNTGFPFAKDAKGVLGELNGKRLSGNPPAIRPFLAGFEPHETGNPLLWGLNRIRNPNTHRMLVPVGAASAGTGLNVHQMSVRGPARIGYSRWDPTKNEVEYLRVGPGSVGQYDVQVSFFVAFGDVGTLAGKDVFSTLDAIASEVERIVLAIKAETERLALAP